MRTRDSRLRIGMVMTVAILLAVTLASPAFAAGGTTIPHSTPNFVAGAQSQGPADPSAVITITVRLQHHNRATREALITQLYTKGSPQYHKFLTAAQYAAQFGPSAADGSAVQDYLKANGLTIVSSDQYSVTARGAIADIQKAFGVQINRYNVGGQNTISNSSDVNLPSPTAGVVSTVQGLHPIQLRSHATRPINPDTGEPFAAIPLTTVRPHTTGTPPAQQFYESQCWGGVESHAFQSGTTTPTLPMGVYSGNRYGGNIAGSYGHLPPCGYEPATLETAYGLSSLYGSGLDGTGQTVVIVDAFGSPTANDDFIVFSEVFGLPTNSLTVYSPFGTPPYNSGWAGETTLDIEWAHAVAPGANIALIQSIDNYDNNLQNAIQWALTAGPGGTPLGNVISNSYGGDEADDDAANMQAWDDLLAQASTMGVSVDFSTGDDGDFYRAAGAYTVSVPSNSPHATAVGGTSDFVNSNSTMKFQTGWGTDLARLSNTVNSHGLQAPLVPTVCATTLSPTGGCFYAGAGGGESTYFTKPAWQSSLPGTGRQQPDIGMTADPYTGVTIIYSYSSPGTFYFGAIGGTSLACPMFSGFWAIVNQAAQNAGYPGPVGQAAPYLYSMPTGAIKDILPNSAYSGTDLAGSIMRIPPSAPLYESPAAVVEPDINTAFTSAFYQGTSTRFYGISFGTDSTLRVTPGWDNVTGMGSPYGWNFVNGVLGQLTPIPE